MYRLGFFSFNIVGLSSPLLCHRTLFLVIFFFVHFQPNFISHSLPYLFPLCLPLSCSSLYAFTLTNRQQEHDLTGITGHQTTRLLGY